MHSHKAHWAARLIAFLALPLLMLAGAATSPAQDNAPAAPATQPAGNPDAVVQPPQPATPAPAPAPPPIAAVPATQPVGNPDAVVQPPQASTPEPAPTPAPPLVVAAPPTAAAAPATPPAGNPGAPVQPMQPTAPVASTPEVAAAPATQPSEAVPATQPSEPAANAAPVAPPGRTSRIIDNSTSDIVPSRVAARPAPLITIGDPFFGPGNIDKGIQLPTGQVWTPTFIIFGTWRSAFQAFENPGTEPASVENKPRTEWANRLDLYGNLQLTGSERVLVGIRPLDDGEFAKPGNARYTGYQFSPSNDNEGWVDDRFNSRITTLFFEGDLGQILGNVDPMDHDQLDIGFSVGRQPLLYQNGLFINDNVDAIGITRNSFLPPGGSNLQITAVYAWGQISSNDGINHDDRGLAGLFFTSDYGPSTFHLDTAYVLGNDDSPGDGVYGAFSATQRLGQFNTTFRILGSKALRSGQQPGDSAFSADGNGSSAVGTGVLLFSEVSRTLPWSKDIVYLDSYWGIDRYTSAARSPDAGGPLGSVGILFAEQPIGRYGSAISSDPERSVGAALGYQKFLDDAQRRQIVLELGARLPTDDEHDSAVAVGARYQQAFGEHFTLQLDSFCSMNESRNFGFGGRVEWRTQF
jgi:hypothetical protein